MFDFLQSAVILVISIVALVAAIYALIHAAKAPAGAFPAAGKQSKVLWVVVMGLAAVIAFVSLPAPLGAGGGPLGLVGILSLVAVIYYLVDVKPKVSGGGGGGWGNSGGGRNTGGW